MRCRFLLSVWKLKTCINVAFPILFLLYIYIWWKRIWWYTLLTEGFSPFLSFRTVKFNLRRTNCR
jgi:hypothetical protein